MEQTEKAIKFDDKGNPIYEIEGKIGTIDDFLSGKAKRAMTCGEATTLYFLDIQVRAREAAEIRE